MAGRAYERGKVLRALDEIEKALPEVATTPPKPSKEPSKPVRTRTTRYIEDLPRNAYLPRREARQGRLHRWQPEDFTRAADRGHLTKLISRERKSERSDWILREDYARLPTNPREL